MLPSGGCVILGICYTENMETITLPKKVTKGRELIVVPKKDFEEFTRWKLSVKAALEKVKKGRAEYKSGKTIVAPSPSFFR